MTSGNLPRSRLREKYLARIEEIDQAPGRPLNSVIEINPDALAIAESLDQERKAKGAARPAARHSRPDQGQHRHRRPHADDRRIAGAGRVRRRRRTRSWRRSCARPGAVILGKTNLSEWANFRSSHSTSGWSGRGGLTRTLMRSTAIPAARVPARARPRRPIFAPSPSAPKPTARLSARRRPMALWESSRRWAWSAAPASFPSPTARTPPAPWRARCATPPSCWACWPAPIRATAQPQKRRQRQPDYTRFLDPDGLRGARIGVARKYFGFSDAVDALMSERIADMKRQGAVIVDPADLESHGKFDDSELPVLLYELKADLNAYLATRPDARRAFPCRT